MDEMADDKGILEKFDRVYSGRLDNLPAQSSKVVRVFTSSTFTDTTTERNSLMEDVYPQLKEYCRKTHGLDFQVVDMRWGVRDEATDDHMTTQLCMNEIGNCQRLSMGPNFVVFLCQKYGYRPLPTTILADELDLLKENLKENGEKIESLEMWYKIETNTVPAVYILQPISSILVNFNNKRIPKLQEQDAASWWETMGKMQTLLRKAARNLYEKGLLTQEEIHNYFMSVTEREVINGILKAKHTKDHCLCYVRHINNINLNNLRAASKYIDISQGQIDSEATKLLSNLRDERVPVKLHANNIARFSVEWQGRDGIDPTNHSDYLNEFCNHFYEYTIALVDRAMKKYAKFAMDPIYTEILQHLHTCHNVSSAFYGRQKELSQVKQYICSDSNEPLILYGEGGCGKTSVLAKIASCVPSWLPDCKPIVVLRFVGTSPESSNICALLTNLCEQIVYNFNQLPGQAPTELSKLFSYFKRMTCLATEQKPIIILLDSLDLLSKADGGHELLWFPPVLPYKVKLIVSTTPGASQIIVTLKRIVENENNYIQITTLGTELAETVIKEWFKTGCRTLTDRQWELVKKALNKSTLALFVKLVFATVYRWKSYSKPQDTILSSSVLECIHALFDRTESQHGKLLVSHALSYITAAKMGISESELEDLLSMDDRVLDDVYQYHLPPVRRIPPLLWARIRSDLPGYLSERAADGVIVLDWYYRQFGEAAKERYFKNLNHLNFTHSSLADYFLGIWSGIPKPFQYTETQRQRFGLIEREGLADRKVPKQPNSFLIEEIDQLRYNQRKLNELPYHLLRAGRYEELFSKCLFNYDFIRSKVSGFPLQAVLADYEDAYNHLQDVHIRRELVLVADALRLSASLLSKHPYMLSFELVARLLPLISDHERVKSLVIQCDLEGPEINCFLPTHNSFHSPGGPLKYSLEDHGFAVFGMKLTNDKKMLVSVSNQFIVYDVQTGDIARRVDPNIDGIMFGLALSSDDKFAATYTNNNEIVLMSMITGEYQSIFPENLSEQMMISGISLTKTEMVFWTKDEWFVYDFIGNLKNRHTADKTSAFSAILLVWYASNDDHTVIYWTDDIENTNLRMRGKVNGLEIEQFDLKDAAILSSDRQYLYGCSQNDQIYSITRFKFSQNTLIAEEKYELLPDKDQKIISLCLPTESNEKYLIIIEGFGYQIINLHSNGHYQLKLPEGIKNIPIKPMFTTSPTVFTPNEEFFAAGVRKNLYIWNLNQQQLIQTIDAHFGRILHLLPFETRENLNTLISSSIDHSIKMWNMNNIFQKSFTVASMDQPAEDIKIATENENIAAIRTRKYVALWDIKYHRIITTLAANIYSAVVTHCLINSNGSRIVSVESDLLLLWDLKTQSVIHREQVLDVRQLFYLQKEQYIITVSIDDDESEVKTVKIKARNADTFEFLYEYSFDCRILKKVVVLKGELFMVSVILHRNREYLEIVHAQTGTPMYKIRPRVKGKTSKSLDTAGIQDISAMTHNPNQILLIDKEHKAYLWDVKNKKLLRVISTFTGSCTSDGKLGLYAPPRGGLQIIDMKSGSVIREMIKQSVEGVNDVEARFSPTNRHIFYYHNGQKTLRIFNVRNGRQLGCFRPHAQLTCFTMTNDGKRVIIGGEDGSVLVTAVIDKEQSNDRELLAKLPSRRALAAHLGLGIEPKDDDDNPTPNILSVTGVTKAVARFKALVYKRQKSTACVIQ